MTDGQLCFNKYYFWSPIEEDEVDFRFAVSLFICLHVSHIVFSLLTNIH
jgi:hypothetical protein